MVHVLAINHSYRRPFLSRRTRERGMWFWNLRHMILPGLVGAAASSAFAVEQAQPWTVTITDPDQRLVEVARGGKPPSIFHYGRSSSGEIYFCVPRSQTGCTVIRGFDPDARHQTFAHLPL